MTYLAMTEAPCRCLWRRWITPGALIFVENAQNVTISPPNTFINEAGCAFGDYARPIALGRNAVDVELDY